MPGNRIFKKKRENNAFKNSKKKMLSECLLFLEFGERSIVSKAGHPPFRLILLFHCQYQLSNLLFISF